MVLGQLLVVERRAEDRVVGGDVLGATGAGEGKDLLLLVGLDALAGLEDKRAIGLHVEHFGGDAGAELVAAVERALALKVAVEVSLHAGRDRADAAALDLEV